MDKRLLVSVAALVLGTPGLALAAGQTLTATMGVSAVVTAGCTDVSATDIDFGSAGQVDADDQATTTISVTCDAGTPYSVEIDYGVTPNGNLRQLSDASSGEFIDYDLYQDANKTLPWGLAADNQALSGTGTGAAQSLPVTAVLHRNSGSSPGTYSDLVTINLNF